MLIASPSNEQLKFARQVRDGKQPTLVFIEGDRLARECLDAEVSLRNAFYLKSVEERLEETLQNLRARNCPVNETEARAFATLTDTVTSQGIVLIAERPVASLEVALGLTGNRPALAVALDRIQDPGNVGAIVRTAEAAGASGVIALAGSASPFAPKSLRSSMGSAFRLPVVGGVHLDSVLKLCHEHRLRAIATSAEAKNEYTQVDWRLPSIVFLGNEAGGLSDEVLAHCHVVVRVPMAKPVESLNAAAAAAVILFEAARQRSA